MGRNNREAAIFVAGVTAGAAALLFFSKVGSGDKAVPAKDETTSSSSFSEGNVSRVQVQVNA